MHRDKCKCIKTKQIIDPNSQPNIFKTIQFLGCAAILAAAQPLKIVFVVVLLCCCVVVLLLLCCCSQINFYTKSFDVAT